jgi:hypothetical protein
MNEPIGDSWSPIGPEHTGLDERHSMSVKDHTAFVRFVHISFVALFAERWLAVPGWPAYEVSSWGRVRSYWKRRGSTGTIGEWARLLAPGVEPKTGHLHVTLCHEGRQVTFKTSRLVLMAFDRSPAEQEEARHYFDPDPSNCHAWNLRWGSKADNIHDYRRHHGNHQNAKITADDVREIRMRSLCGQSYFEIARRFNVSKSNVYQIVNRRSWAHVE